LPSLTFSLSRTLSHYNYSGRDIALSSNQSPVVKFYNLTYPDYKRRLETYTNELYHVRGMQLWNDWNVQVAHWARNHSQQSPSGLPYSFEYMALRSEDLLDSQQRYHVFAGLAHYVQSTWTPHQVCCLSRQEPQDMGASGIHDVFHQKVPQNGRNHHHHRNDILHNRLRERLHGKPVTTTTTTTNNNNNNKKYWWPFERDTIPQDTSKQSLLPPQDPDFKLEQSRLRKEKADLRDLQDQLEKKEASLKRLDLELQQRENSIKALLEQIRQNPPVPIPLVPVNDTDIVETESNQVQKETSLVMVGNKSEIIGNTATVSHNGIFIGIPSKEIQGINVTILGV